MSDDRSISDMRFGQALRRARKDEGLTQGVLGKAIGRSDGHISNVELGKRFMQSVDVRKADKALKANGRLVRLHKELYEQGTMDWLDNLERLQREAEIIREWQPDLIPGILQTEDYARAVVAATSPWRTPDSVDRKVQARMRHAARLLGEPTPHYHALIDDAAIMRPVGGPGVMAAQLRALVDHVREGRVMLQCHPFDAWPHAGLAGAFSLLSSASAPETVHVDSVYRGQQTDTPQTVRQFTLSFLRIQASSRTPQDTVAYLKGKIEEYERT
ncbi:helix-turn-helix domain-containing protein [Streptomonospora nanhaiensis]|uniref:helix-turn-helix domain-containing protein n=1 Tax=Streptomonospora nanhaiensis TaxID=1323731 RepID=UPI001C38EF1C|nr:helix-turn-helix transcriptional regulator [Streptomonospora nanhaiensis]MBV2366029.1 helix-turn-helix domain-containing protein [Streptomonospora nanhaiensis]